MLSPALHATCILLARNTVVPSIHVATILYIFYIDMTSCVKIPSGAAVKGEGGVAGEGKLVSVPKVLLLG